MPSLFLNPAFFESRMFERHCPFFLVSGIPLFCGGLRDSTVLLWVKLLFTLTKTDCFGIYAHAATLNCLTLVKLKLCIHLPIVFNKKKTCQYLEANQVVIN